jgi:hypothetical protein
LAGRVAEHHEALRTTARGANSLPYVRCAKLPDLPAPGLTLGDECADALMKWVLRETSAEGGSDFLVSRVLQAEHPRGAAQVGDRL